MMLIMGLGVHLDLDCTNTPRPNLIYQAACMCSLGTSM